MQNFKIVGYLVTYKLFYDGLTHMDRFNTLFDAEELIEATSNEGLARDYALAFLSDVDWWAIADHLVADTDDEDEEESEEEEQA